MSAGAGKWRLNSNRENTGYSVIRTQSPPFEEKTHVQVATRKKVVQSQDENLFFSPFLIHAKELSEHIAGNVKSIKGVWECEE